MADVGLFGGTFNPIHHGHLIAVQEAAFDLNLDRVCLIPTASPPHKDAPDVSPDHRYEMVERAVHDRNQVKASSIELELDGPSYTINTINALQNKSDRFFLLIGADELINFTRWHQWSDILDRVNLVALNRPGFDLTSISESLAKQTEFVEIPQIQISSSFIRQRFSQNEPVRSFLPARVYNYILEHNLYEP